MRNWLIASLMLVLSVLTIQPSFSATAPAECVSVEAAIKIMTDKYPDATFAVYEGQEAQAIQDGMAQMGAKLEGRRTFVVFQNGSGVDLLIGFKNGCYEGAAQVPHRFIDAWLAGVPA
jgi:hypothetical protein